VRRILAAHQPESTLTRREKAGGPFSVKGGATFRKREGGAKIAPSIPKEIRKRRTPEGKKGEASLPQLGDPFRVPGGIRRGDLKKKGSEQV